MPTAPPDFSVELRVTLRQLIATDRHADATVRGSPEECVSQVLSRARFASAALNDIWTDSSEVRAEHQTVLTMLHRASTGLREASPIYARRFRSDCCPAAVAAQILSIASQLDLAGPPRVRRRPAVREGEVMRELTRNVLPVLKQHGIAPAAYVSADERSMSTAVAVLRAIANDLSLVRSPFTWRDHIVEYIAALRGE